MEDLGFYEKGKAVDAVKDGESRRDGVKPAWGTSNEYVERVSKVQS